MSHKAYLWTVATAFLIACGLSATINYLVDPYGLFGIERVAGLNAIKPAAADHLRTVKPYQVRRNAPRTLIGGNSRPEAGIDPASACWHPEDRPVYNLGVPGAGLYMQFRYIQNSLLDGHTKTVLLGIDLVDFLVPDRFGGDFAAWPGQAQAFEARLRYRADGTANPSYRLHALGDRLAALFSLNALADSMTTLVAQSNPNATNREATGFNPGRDFYDIIAAEGQNLLFVQKNREMQNRLNPNAVIFQDGSDWSTAFESLSRLLRAAKSVDARVILFINPYHADYLATIDARGLWDILEEWKRRLVRLTSNRSNTVLWDFNGFNTFTTEQPPPRGDTSSVLRWFWEPAHYRPAFGNLMLAAMLQRPCGTPAEDPPPGVRLDSFNIEPHLARLRDERTRFLKAHPEVQDRLRASLNR